MREPAFASGETADVATLSRAGLLRAAEGSVISPLAVFLPAVQRNGARIGAITGSVQFFDANLQRGQVVGMFGG